jgi:hypothetical protein
MNDKRVIDFRYAPDHPQSCIGLVDDFYKSIIREDGSLNFGYDKEVELSYYQRNNDEKHPVNSRIVQNKGFKFRYKPEFTHRDKLIGVTQDFGKASAALVKTVEDYEASTLTWTSFAWKNEAHARVDVLIWKLETKPCFKETHSAVVLLELGETCDNTFVIKNVPGQKTVAKDGVETFRIASEEVIEGAFFIVHEGELKDTEVTLENAKKAEVWAAQYWENAKPFLNEFQIPDESIMEMLASCGRNILQAREIQEKAYRYQVGPTIYRGLWFVDGFFILESAHMMGRRDEAYAGILEVLKQVHMDGSIQIMDKHDKETGIALATFVRQCEIMGDDERFMEIWPICQRALGYIKKQREATFALGEDYLARGLFSPCLGDGGINIDPEYTTPLWVLHGLKSVYLTGKRLNLPGYEEFKAEFDDLMKTFKMAAARDTRVTADGISYIPMSMLSEEAVLERIREGQLKPDIISYEEYKPQTGTWAFDQAIYPGEVFEPDSEEVKNLTALFDSVDDQQGLPVNTGWMPFDGLWPYAGMFDAHVWLYAGNGEKAADYLYAFANHAASSRCWREEQALAGTQSSEMCGDMPHNWGSAMFIILCRNLILLEKKENLELLAGLTDEWLPRDGKILHLEKSPTKYGEVTIKMTEQSDDIYELSYYREGRRNPEQIIINWDGIVEADGVEKQGNAWVIDGATSEFKAQLKKNG